MSAILLFAMPDRSVMDPLFTSLMRAAAVTKGLCWLMGNWCF